MAEMDWEENIARVDRIIDSVLGFEDECSHPWRHTTHKGREPSTWCQICGAKLISAVPDRDY